MPRVRCPQRNCVFWDEDYCSAEEIELDPEQLSCLTMEELEDEVIDEEDVWDDEDLLEDDDIWAEDEDDWLEEEEDELDSFVLSDEDEW
ncbi:MAG TPA: DUF1540 domain-containing protein [Caldilineae bacterium]|nr:DUF1540 domain-containing protein [Caldilineae bacterium]